MTVRPCDLPKDHPGYDPFDDGKPRKSQAAPTEELELWPDTDLSQISGKAPAKFKKADHNLRTRKLFEDEGWFVFRVDQTRTSFSGSIYTVDFLGLFDWMAVKPDRQVLGIQVCAKSGLGSHVTKMTSTEETSFNKSSKIDNLKRWLDAGLKAVLVGWAKEGSRWQPTYRKLGLEEVEAALSRKKRRIA